MVSMSTDEFAKGGSRGPVADVADRAAARLARAAATGIPCPPVRDLIGADDVLADKALGLCAARS
jgi:2-keto-4-pentenoate hydratase